MTMTAKTGSTAAIPATSASRRCTTTGTTLTQSLITTKSSVSVLSTSPAGSGKTYVNYTVTHKLSYTGDKDATSVTDTCQNGIISQDSDGDYVLEKLGTPNAK
ncbi:hypothetical protein [Lactobacillus delbrueckii]|uniref:hypothetical protein n=2 Tax=Lactobacillus delbrueckii TaxID=1584 RepID=UPI001E3AD591|nr:hypothetical protein [Lactobacillus delbrueckii]MCD5440113.1 hypothetical protein [Lactobacillus delbrueckii subsp. lactis]MCD5484339.1 hypothetical protein [Lactobacillus delbrueckii subsp. lactis]